MNNRIIPESELPLNADGSVFHLHLKPEMLSDKIIMVGDPARVNMVASFFDDGSKEFDITNREYHTVTGCYKGQRITCLSHGIGIGNIDIVMNELDALANIDLENRTEYEEKRSLTIVRVGTSGSLQDDVPIGSYVVSEKSVGFDGMLNFYNIPSGAIDLEFEFNLCKALDWNNRLARPYVVDADEQLVRSIGFDMVRGATISAPGFYGPQGRFLRAMPNDIFLNEKIKKFEFKGQRIINYEMESSAIAGLAKLLGHRAVTVCDIIAGRCDKTMNVAYADTIKILVGKVLDRIILS